MRVSAEMEAKCLALAGEQARSIEPVTGTVSEKAFMAAVLKLARRHSWLCYHVHDSRKGAAGWPDVAFCRGSVMFFAELKAESGNLTADQETWIEAIRAAGIVAHVWRPSQWEEIEWTLTADASTN